MSDEAIVDPKPLPTVLSLGAGVQSSVLALMAAEGLITPMPIAAIFADTHAEPKPVYDWLQWLETVLPFPVIKASYGDLGEDSLRVRRSKKSGLLYSANTVPVFALKPDGKKGMFQRRCTGDYKVNVVQREIKKLLGLRRVKKSSGILCEQWIGISVDEAHRMKDPRVPWIRNRWPLVDLGMSRQDCLNWMKDRGYPQPPRSACVFCPYHSDSEWHRLKTQDPDGFQDAVKFEQSLQQSVGKTDIVDSVPYLHSSCIPLKDVTFDPDGVKDSFGNECEGMCGN